MNCTNWPDCETGTCACRPVSDRRAIMIGRVAAFVVALIALGLLLTVARAAAKTHCKSGHPLSGANLYVNPAGARICKECRKGHWRAYVQRNS